MKTDSEYVLITEFITQDDDGSLIDYSNRKNQEALSGALSARFRDCVKEAEDAPYEFSFEIVSHAITSLNKAVFLSLVVRKIPV